MPTTKRTYGGSKATNIPQKLMDLLHKTPFFKKSSSGSFSSVPSQVDSPFVKKSASDHQESPPVENYGEKNMERKNSEMANRVYPMPSPSSLHPNDIHYIQSVLHEEIDRLSKEVRGTDEEKKEELEIDDDNDSESARLDLYPRGTKAASITNEELLKPLSLPPNKKVVGFRSLSVGSSRDLTMNASSPSNLHPVPETSQRKATGDTPIPLRRGINFIEEKPRKVNFSPVPALKKSSSGSYASSYDNKLIGCSSSSPGLSRFCSSPALSSSSSVLTVLTRGGVQSFDQSEADDTDYLSDSTRSDVSTGSGTVRKKKVHWDTTSLQEFRNPRKLEGEGSVSFSRKNQFEIPRRSDLLAAKREAVKKMVSDPELEKLPWLPASSGQHKLVQCQFCPCKLLVPPSLELSGKKIQKLRCAKCRQVSSFRVYQPEAKSENHAKEAGRTMSFREEVEKTLATYSQKTLLPSSSLGRSMSRSAIQGAEFHRRRNLQDV